MARAQGLGLYLPNCFLQVHRAHRGEQMACTRHTGYSFLGVSTAWEEGVPLEKGWDDELNFQIYVQTVS